MARGQLTRTVGWIAIGVVAGAGTVAALLSRWDVVGVTVVLLLAANVAMSFDQRARDARTAQAIRALHRDQRGASASLAELRRRSEAWRTLPDTIREQDSRLVGVLETERIVAEERAEHIISAIERNAGKGTTVRRYGRDTSPA